MGDGNFIVFREDRHNTILSQMLYADFLCVRLYERQPRCELGSDNLLCDIYYFSLYRSAEARIEIGNQSVREKPIDRLELQCCFHNAWYL